jgi:hypothetical protein
MPSGAYGRDRGDLNRDRPGPVEAAFTGRARRCRVDTNLVAMRCRRAISATTAPAPTFPR